ncbi:MAG: ketoacyl-ACP synthase III [Deltaproteobacteria bacterium]|nr:MAG: ketoacyl-ACP synthase III [Deltaproteobacteria bacterium]
MTALRHSAIVSTGIYVPSREVSNDVLRDRFAALGEYVDKMEGKTGIKTRWYADEDEVTSDLAARAARHALDRAGVAPEDVDLILLGTDTPDYITPATSVVVQAKLGAHRAGTFDIGCACASFPTALATANGLIATNPSLKNVLVIGAYLMHKLADPNDPAVFFYGDAAGAALVRPSETPGVLGAAFQADGRLAKNWGIFAGGTAEPASVDAIAGGRTQVRIVEGYPKQVNEEGWVRLLRRLADEQGFAVRDLDQVIFTQVNRATIEKVCGTLELPLERAHLVMDRYGYTGSACIPLALHDAIAAGKVRHGDLVAMVGSGVGYNQAAVAFRVTDALVLDA